MINRRNLLQLSAGALAGSAFGAFPAFGQSAKNWDFADEYVASLSPGRAANYFIEELNKQVGDELTITYQGGGALGYKSAEHFNAVETGAVPMAITLVTQLNGVDPLLDLTNLPFLVRNAKESQDLWNIARDEYAKIFEENDQIALFAAPSPPSGIHSRVALDNPDVFKGLRIRTFDRISTTTLANAGASPLQVAWADVVPLLSTGALDAMLTSADGGVSISVWDFLGHFTELNYSSALYIAHVNRYEFEALSPRVQDAIMALCRPTDDYAWKTMGELVETGYGKLREHGTQVNTNPPAAVFDLLAQAGEAAKAEWLERVGDRGAAIMEAFEASRA
ncbi:TRAP transporter substrate-binding protein [Devosia ginsengisoli]|uniref:TRAP transporter substrate-binding protein n=1 Tax=Devosia ginsengisoli TaxID=400770 RepID=UPI0026EE8119|nr:TRAP transporter substrate-binding protein [Devosia ginsengisoli]MCR6671354.1 TRAP transporter substrate-binding protein [Devosia ginsengisoli]